MSTTRGDSRSRTLRRCELHVTMSVLTESVEKVTLTAETRRRSGPICHRPRRYAMTCCWRTVGTLTWIISVR